jgi:hypothetical protein
VSCESPGSADGVGSRVTGGPQKGGCGHLAALAGVADATNAANAANPSSNAIAQARRIIDSPKPAQK